MESKIKFKWVDESRESFPVEKRVRKVQNELNNLCDPIAWGVRKRLKINLN